MWDNKIDDRFLFNRETFKQSLSRSTRPLSLFREVLKEGDAYLKDQFRDGEPISMLIHKRAWLVDQLLDFAWQISIHTDNLSLVAVGGYGRGELHPESDIDLMILEGTRTRAEIKQQI